MLDLKKEIEKEKETEDFESEGEEETENSSLFTTKIYNWLENNFHLSNKKALFWNISEYYKSWGQDPWDALPVTFHIDHGLNDPEYKKFIEYYQKVETEIKNF